MKWEQRRLMPWALFGMVILCAWCSVLSALGGWIMGRDLAQREAGAAMATATAGDLLPPLGVLVTRLVRAGPAEQAGIQRGDMIVAIDDVYIQDARDLRDQLNRRRPGDRVRLSIVRDRGEQQASVQLAVFPGDPTRPYLGMYYTARPDEPGDL
jgi:S1-C subfamily serine protease